MRVVLKAGILAVSPENEAEREAFAVWRDAARGHAFYFDGGSTEGGALRDLGPRDEACREPINIVFDETEARWLPISNLAHTSFVMRGVGYASVEGFWQGLKFEDAAKRAAIAPLWGMEAKRAGGDAPEGKPFTYAGVTHAVGGASHRALMLEACRAKFGQNLEAREALLSTGSRPLTHLPRRDSKTIPGALMADIWMRIRAHLLKELT